MTFSLKPSVLIKKKARSYPIHECRITNAGAEGGKYDIIVARKKPNGDLIVGFYLVDTWCLGLKDTFYRHDMSVHDYEETIEDMEEDGFGAVTTEVCDPNHAFNLIYGAIEYAEDIGFQPHKDFEVTEYILPDVDDVEYEDIEFGKDGMPFYVDGPDDNVAAVLARLEKNVGQGNFHFMTQVRGPEEWDDDLEFDPVSNWREEHFPQEAIDIRVESFPEEQRLDYLLHVVVASLIGDMLDGQFEELEEAYDEDFLEELMVELESAVDEMWEMENGGKQKEEFYPEDWKPLISFMVGKIIQTGGVGFLLDEDFKPFPFSNIADMEGLSEKEQMEMLDTLVVGMLPSKLVDGAIIRLTINMVIEHYGDSVPEKVTDRAVKEKVLQGVVEALTQEELGSEVFETQEELEDYCRVVAFDVMEDLDKYL